MPGATPYEAVRAFLEPFQENLAILDGNGQINSTRKGGYALGHEYAWVINAGCGMTLPNLGLFTASMSFEIVETGSGSGPDRYRVTTRSYNYRLRHDDHGDLWRCHWHPEGVSKHKRPHLHFPPHFTALETPRVSFEFVLRWCMDHGAALTVEREEAERMLSLTEGLHQLHRSWSVDPDQPHPQP